MCLSLPLDMDSQTRHMALSSFFMEVLMMMNNAAVPTAEFLGLCFLFGFLESVMTMCSPVFLACLTGVFTENKSEEGRRGRRTLGSIGAWTERENRDHSRFPVIDLGMRFLQWGVRSQEL